METVGESGLAAVDHSKSTSKRPARAVSSRTGRSTSEPVLAKPESFHGLNRTEHWFCSHLEHASTASVGRRPDHDRRTRLRNQYRVCAVFTILWAAKMFYAPAPTILQNAQAAAVALFTFWGGYKWMKYREK
jgi:hypothetical protein